MMIKRALALAALAASVALAGCWDSSDVVVHKQGEYKGTSDPLLSQQASAREDALKKRFQLVQADR